jgi:hypothetical protein
MVPSLEALDVLGLFAIGTAGTSRYCLSANPMLNYADAKMPSDAKSSDTCVDKFAINLEKQPLEQLFSLW